MKNSSAAICLLAGAMLSSCNVRENITKAEKAVDEFHLLYDTGKPELIHQKADAALKATTTEQDMVAFVNGVHGKLGRITSSTNQNSSIFSGTNGTEVRLVYRTIYEQGTGTEKFTYLIQRGKPALLSWFIDSPQLTSHPSKKEDPAGEVTGR